MIDINKVPVTIVRQSIMPATWEDIKPRLGVKDRTKTIQLFQILRFLWTREVVALLRNLDLPKIAKMVEDGWSPLYGRWRADLVGMEMLMDDPEYETRDQFIRRTVREVTQQT